jgi:hypothetical protein
VYYILTLPLLGTGTIGKLMPSGTSDIEASKKRIGIKRESVFFVQISMPLR